MDLTKIILAKEELRKAIEIYQEKGRKEVKDYIKHFCWYLEVNDSPFSFGYSFLEVKDEM